LLEGGRVEACSIAYLPTSEDHSDVYVFGMVRRAMKKRCVFCLAVFCECDASILIIYGLLPIAYALKSCSSVTGDGMCIIS